MTDWDSTAVFTRRLFEQHATAVYRYFHRFTGDASAAEDLTQDVFVRVLRGGGAYEHRDTERAWLFRIARNILIDRRRAQSRGPAAALSVEPVVAARQPIRVSVREALSRIPADEREAFLLREIAGLSYSEIAAATDSTIPAVRSRIYRARLTLRDMLNPPAPLHAAVVRRHDDHD